MSPWWQREGLAYEGGRLQLGGQDLQALAISAGTPTYVYHMERILANARRLLAALATVTPRHRLFYAMKSNRYAPMLTSLRASGLCGIDACSPGEVVLARQVGFREDQISFTATSLSNEDIAFLARHPGVWVNCDSLSAIRRLGALCPGREIGLRVNPGLGVGYRANALLQYAGAKNTKFGIYQSEFAEALELAASLDLKVSGLHFHTGCGYLTPQLEAWSEILAACKAFRLPGLKHVNVGGGLGIPLVADDEPLDLQQWAATLAKHFENVEVWVEPGDYLVKDSGVLLLGVTQVERKNGTTFVGLDGGFNIHIEPAVYSLPLEPVPLLARDGAQRVTLAGNINEAMDVLGEDVALPPLAEGDVLAFLNAGGYGAAMASNHCLRGHFSEYLVP